MSREANFGYGFWFVGVGAPYLIDKLAGRTQPFDVLSFSLFWAACY
jgi:hypothetical protein